MYSRDNNTALSIINPENQLDGIGSFLKKGASATANAVKKGFSAVTHAVLPDKIAKELDKAFDHIDKILVGVVCFPLLPSYLLTTCSYKLLKKQIIKKLKKDLPKKLWDKGFKDIQKATKKGAEKAVNSLFPPYHAVIIAESTALGGAAGSAAGSAIPLLGTASGAVYGASIGAIAGQIAAGQIKKVLVKIVSKGTTLTFKQFKKDIEKGLDTKDFNNAVEVAVAETAASFPLGDVISFPIAGLHHSQFRDSAYNFKMGTKLIKQLRFLYKKGVMTESQYKKLNLKLVTNFIMPFTTRKRLHSQNVYSAYLTVAAYGNKYIKNYLKKARREADDLKKRYAKNIKKFKKVSALTTMQVNVKIAPNKIKKVSLTPTNIVAESKFARDTAIKMSAPSPFKIPASESVAPIMIPSSDAQGITIAKPIGLPSGIITPADTRIDFAKVSSFYNVQKDKINDLRFRVLQNKDMKDDPEIKAKLDAVNEKVKKIFLGAATETMNKNPALKPKMQSMIQQEGLGIFPLILGAIIAAAGATACTSWSLSDYLETQAETEQLEKLIDAKERGIDIERKGMDLTKFVPIGLGVLLLGGGGLYVFSKLKK